MHPIFELRWLPEFLWAVSGHWSLLEAFDLAFDCGFFR
jgi:hypothetical protein